MPFNIPQKAISTGVFTFNSWLGEQMAGVISEDALLITYMMYWIISSAFVVEDINTYSLVGFQFRQWNY